MYNSWGPGKFDPRFNHDGINFPVVIPPAYGLNGVGYRRLRQGASIPSPPSVAERYSRGRRSAETCHMGSTYTDVLSGPEPTVPVLHDPSETGVEPVYASRSATKQYRTTPLRGLWQHPPYFHDGSAPDLPAVVNHYDQFLGLLLSDKQKSDLVEFLKSL